MKYVTIIICYLILGCAPTEKKITDHVVPIDIESDKAFEHIGDIVENKDIVLLGESEHGDGRTHEMKSHLIKYLVEEKGFNTIALEGVGFLDMEILNTETPLDSLMVETFKGNWLNWLGSKKQKQDLTNTIKHHRPNLIGIESFSYLLPRAEDILWQKYFNTNPHPGDESSQVDVARLKKITYHINRSDTSKVSLKDIEFYKQELKAIQKKITCSQRDIFEPKEKEILLMAIENMISYAQQFKYFNLIGTDEAISKWVNIRDAQMAKNLIWHKKRNPDAKIIVWAANFHGAKKISDIRYKANNSELYDNYVLFGEHLYNAYGNEVYSIAFTSSKGESARIFEEKVTKIDAPEGTLEQELEDMEIKYGFIDFSAIRKSDPSLKNKTFNTIILGHDNKPGKWLNVFDGVFFIQKNERTIKQDY